MRWNVKKDEEIIKKAKKFDYLEDNNYTIYKYIDLYPIYIYPLIL